jgi:hypothetical protein
MVPPASFSVAGRERTLACWLAPVRIPGRIRAGRVQNKLFVFTTPILTGQAFPFAGGFDGGGQRPKDVIRFLHLTTNPYAAKNELAEILFSSEHHLQVSRETKIIADTGGPFGTVAPATASVTRVI